MDTEEIKLTVMNESGLHTRAAAQIVEAAKRFKAEITLEKDGSKADAKSIMGILILAAQQNSEVYLRASGNDAREAVTAIRKLFRNRFGEKDSE